MIDVTIEVINEWQSRWILSKGRIRRIRSDLYEQSDITFVVNVICSKSNVVILSIFFLSINNTVRFPNLELQKKNCIKQNFELNTTKSY